MTTTRWFGFILVLAWSPLASAACSEAKEPDEEGAPTAGGTGASPATGGENAGASAGGNGNAGTSGVGGSTAGVSPGGGGGFAGSGGAPAAGAGGSSGADIATEPPDAGPPPATDAGLSLYSGECRGETVSCADPSVHCLGIFLHEGGVGYACSNQCRTLADCSEAPSGGEARAGCVQFTSASRCVLVCYDHGAEFSCPSGMGCYRYPDMPIGYCLWL